MCYSAGASLVASAGLATIGVASFRVADRKHKALAAIPFIFAIQQAFEGYQWISIDSGSVSFVAAYGFLFFALLLWPIYVPVTVFNLDKKRRKVLGLLIVVGIVVATYFLYLMLFGVLEVSVKGSSLCYNIDTPFHLTIAVSYVLATCGAMLVSSKTGIKWIGLVFTIAMVISALFFSYAFLSVWCFFSAIVSSMIYFYVKSIRK